MTVLRSGSATDVGLVRANNQDRALVAEPLFAVADGMGGHAAGEVASATAVTALEAAFTDHSAEGLAAAARTANRAVWDHAQSDIELRGMGTTLVALALVGTNGAQELAVANVGDSRLYLLRQGELVQVTADHSLVAELVAQGQIGAEEAEVHPQRHVLTRALGVDADVPVDIMTVDLVNGDRYLLCSDGLSRELSDEQTASVLRRLADPGEAARQLVSEARARGGNDNITVVVVDVVDDADHPAGTATPPVTTSEPVAPLPSGKGSGDAPTIAAGITDGVAAVAPGRRRWGRSSAPGPPTRSPFTLRVLAFFLLVLLIGAVAVGGVSYYGRNSWFVGLSGRQLVIYQGRPGGVLWLQPTVAGRPAFSTAEILPRHLPELQAGKVEASLGAARQYVANLRSEYLSAHPGAGVPPSAPTLPTPPPSA